MGMGMVFVLLTYGGWNEAAYLSGELRNPGRNMSRVLLVGTVIVTGAYVLTNLALLEIFGLQGLRDTPALGADVMQLAAGPYAAALLSLTICATALSTINGTIITGARVYYALVRDVPRLHALAGWSARKETPVAALLAQGAITLVLVALGAFSQNSVQTLVAYTAPVFWIFMLLVAASVWRLRQLDPERPRPFRVPLYPLPPLLLGLTCAGLVYSSAVYAGAGALIGLAVLAAGIPMLRLLKPAGMSGCRMFFLAGAATPAVRSQLLTYKRRAIVVATAMALSLAYAAIATAQPAAKPAAAAGTQEEYVPDVGQDGKDVIWVPTPQTLVDKMLDMAKVTPQDRLMDLGSGDGRTVITAAQRGLTAQGIEYNPDLV
ncbi:hypothetical protein G6F31_014163 [Rhizopus arrhizus]|nr:hypothetical protein G6F31_014163 [Rhizopus arrhizus]